MLWYKSAVAIDRRLERSIVSITQSRKGDSEMAKRANTIYTVSIDYNSYTSENLAHALCHEHLSGARLYVAIIRSVWNGESYEATTIGYGARIGDVYGVDLTVSAQATVEERETIEQWIEPIEEDRDDELVWRWNMGLL